MRPRRSREQHAESEGTIYVKEIYTWDWGGGNATVNPDGPVAVDPSTGPQAKTVAKELQKAGVGEPRPTKTFIK